MVALPEPGHAGADLAHDARALVAQDRREEPLGIRARPRELVGVTDPGGHDLDQDLARFRPLEIDFDDFEGLARLEGDRRTCLH